MIKLVNVTKKFGDKVAVDNLTLEIKSGEFFTILGPNGAGKTTTIKMISGLLQPTSGAVYVGGYDMSKDHLNAKQLLSYIPDEPFVYDKLTGAEFLNFIGKMYKLDGSYLTAEINHYIKQFAMEEFINNLTETYSHGMKQRLAICSALLHKPRIIVVDEPLVGLDPLSAKLVKDIFKQLIQEGVTIFMSTHILSIAEEVSHRISIILDGKLITSGTTQQLKETYKIQGTLEEAFFKIISSVLPRVIEDEKNEKQ